MDNEMPEGRELDVRIAETCGWQWWTYYIDNAPTVTSLWKPDEEPTDDAYDQSEWRKGRNNNARQFNPARAPRYSSTLATAFSLGDEAVRLGFEEEYIDALCFSVNWAVTHRSPACQERMDLAHASALTRAQAFYRAYQAWKEKADDTANR